MENGRACNRRRFRLELTATDRAHGLTLFANELAFIPRWLAFHTPGLALIANDVIYIGNPAATLRRPL